MAGVVCGSGADCRRAGTGALRRAVLLASATVLTLAAAPAYAAAPANGGSPGAYTVGDCSQADQQQVRAEIERHVLLALTGSRQPLDIDGIVARHWRMAEMDAAIDTAVQQSVDSVANQENLLDKFISGWWSDKAQEYAERIANAAFSSPAFKAKLDALSQAVGAEVAQQVQARFAQAASVGLLCLQEYVGSRYSGTMFDAFQRSVQTETGRVDVAANNVPVFNVVDQHKLALAGIGAILITQVTYRLAQKLSEKIADGVASKILTRVLGKAGSSLVPVAGWIVGLGLLAYDLWDSSQGAFPQIQQSLQSEDVKARIRSEIATSVRDDLPTQSALIALETATNLTEQWQGFCGKYGYLCMLADQNQAFRTVLNRTSLSELDSLSALSDWFMAAAGRVELENALADGSLEQLAMLSPDEVAAVKGALEPAAARAWVALAGARLPTLIAYGVQTLTAPGDWTPAALAAVLALPDRNAAAKVLALTRSQRAALLTLPQEALPPLVQNAAPEELTWLAAQAAAGATAPQQAGRLLAALRQHPASVQAVRQELAPPPTPTPAVVAAAADTLGGANLESATGVAMLQAPADNGTMVRLGGLGIVVLLLLAAVTGVGYLGWRRRSAGRSD